MRNQHETLGELLNLSLDMIQKRQDNNGITGISSGFPLLDMYTLGWQNGELIILGSRPSAGKTSFALNMARHAAAELNVPTAFFSLDMTNIEIADRLIAMESGVSIDKIMGYCKLEDEDWACLERSISRLEKAPLYIDSTPELSISEFVTKSRLLKQEQGIGIIFVDYLQLMYSSPRKSGNYEQEASAVSQALKETAMELDIPIIALSQMKHNKGMRHVKNGRPIIRDLREYDSIEPNADLIVFIHRLATFGVNKTLSPTEVIVAKNRHGMVGTFEMSFNEGRMRFDDALCP